GGHSDVFMGSVAVTSAALEHAVRHTLIDYGWAVNGEDAYLMLRGLRTLPTRLQRCGGSSLEVAAWVAEQPEGAQGRPPALPGPPGHELWRRDYVGAAGLFGFVLKPAPLAAVEAFLDALQLFGLGFSWGGFESLAIHCAPQLEVRAMPPKLEGPLIRLNIGLEDPDDLIADLRRGLPPPALPHHLAAPAPLPPPPPPRGSDTS